MTRENNFGAVDYFRIVAALMVIAIHTSPLLIFGERPDFISARIIARIAVPFFIMSTGFFMDISNSKAIKKFVKKTLVLYIAAVLLYLPVTIYTGRISAHISLAKIAKMLLVDGTMYHLWYLPAVIIAVPLVWLLLQKSSFVKVFTLAVILYCFGLFGDSYYGFIEPIPAVKNIYDAVFVISSYTRNGLFYAPLFIVLGVWLRKNKTLFSLKKASLAFVVCLCGMVMEGLVLHTMDVQRHDSMYVLLPFCTLFLFAVLLHFSIHSIKDLRDISLVVYIIHPWIIVLFRGGAKKMGLTGFLINNSIVYYFCVSALSFAVAFGVWAIKHRLNMKNKIHADNRAWVEIDLKALEHNVVLLKKMLPATCELMPAVKANAYGFGAVPICKVLNKLGIRSFCVACVEEGIELRKHRIKGDILVLGFTHPENFALLYQYRLTQTVIDYAYAKKLYAYRHKIQVHIKIDSGMHRLGEGFEQVQNILHIFALPNLCVTGIFTQLSSSDSSKPEDITYAKYQIENFYGLLAELQKQGVKLPKQHVQCSYGIINYPDLQCDFARPGLALYGIVDENMCIGNPPELVPVFTVKARVALTKNIRENERVGYGQACIAKQKMSIAVISMGYGDGLPRALSCGAGGVLINGQYALIVGNICMDQAIVDITGLENITSGDIVTVVGVSGERSISIQEIAQQAGTIPNEIISRLGGRIVREYV